MTQQNYYTQIAFCLLPTADKSLLTCVPLFVRVKEVTKNGVAEMQEDIVHRTAKVMREIYKQDFDEYLTKIKGVKNETNSISGGM
jgi:hypothetical protein